MIIFEQIEVLKRQISNLTKVQWVFIVLVFLIFISPLILGAGIFISIIYFLYTGDIKKTIFKRKTNILLNLFCIISLLTSLFHQNYLGALVSLGFYAVFLLIFIFKENVDLNFFYLMIKIISIMSLFVFVIGLVQFYQISSTTNPEAILKISDAPNERVTGTFWNANFYATILEFVIILAFYKMFLVKEKESSFAFYFTVIILNIFMLYLTGSRTAWLTLFLVIPIMFLFQRKFYIGISLIVLSILGLYFTISLDIFPRVSSINKDFLFRVGIWKDSLATFKDHFLFGVGPLAYLKISYAKGGPLVAHSHSLYIDSLLSYGIVGCTTLFLAVVFYLKHLFSYYQKKTYSFAVGVILAVLIHGFLDITILSPQVGFLFLLIISSIHVDDYENA